MKYRKPEVRIFKKRQMATTKRRGRGAKSKQRGEGTSEVPFIDQDKVQAKESARNRGDLERNGRGGFKKRFMEKWLRLLFRMFQMNGGRRKGTKGGSPTSLERV